MLLNTFGERVRFIRKLWGIPQLELQKEGGPARTTLFRIERGEALPEDLTENTLKGLSVALKCNRLWLEKGLGSVWLEGIVPPEGGRDTLRENTLPSGPMVLSPPVLGKYMSDGPIDWEIGNRVVAIVHQATLGANFLSQKFKVNEAEACRLVYKYLSTQENPLAPVELSVIHTILSTAYGA